MTTILLAMDDSEASRHAASSAHRLFGADATYLAIYVADDPVATSSLTWGSVYGYPHGWTPDALEEMADASTAVVDRARDEAAEHAEDAGVHADPIGAVGDPPSAIARAARDHGVDAIVVGHHHRSWFASVFDPSIVDDVIDLADVPVVVVPDTE